MPIQITNKRTIGSTKHITVNIFKMHILALCVLWVIFPSIFCNNFEEFSLVSRFYIKEWNLPCKILETLRKCEALIRTLQILLGFPIFSCHLNCLRRGLKNQVQYFILLKQTRHMLKDTSWGLRCMQIRLQYQQVFSLLKLHQFYQFLIWYSLCNYINLVQKMNNHNGNKNQNIVQVTQSCNSKSHEH